MLPLITASNIIVTHPHSDTDWKKTYNSLGSSYFLLENKRGQWFYCSSPNNVFCFTMSFAYLDECLYNIPLYFSAVLK